MSRKYTGTASFDSGKGNTMKITFLEVDEFIPLLTIEYDKVKDAAKKIYEIDGDELTGTTESVTLSEHIASDKRTLNIQQLTTSKKKIKLTFKVKKGTESNFVESLFEDDDGYIEPKLSIEDDNFKIVSELKNHKKYGDKIEVEIELNAEERKEFYLDFYAKDDEDFFNNGEYENVYCGQVKIEYKNQSKVGIRLTSNIENLPQTPAGYKRPATFTAPKKSFEVANKYQNCYGMCFAVSMARVKQAYLDEFNTDVISLNLKGNDYLYSGTVIPSIPDQYFGYGVGGALASNRYATLIDENSVKNGDLEEGAMLQYWNVSGTLSFTDLKKAIKDTLKGTTNSDFSGGHSVVFKSYTKDSSGNITGLKYYDYSGINRSYSFASNSKMFLGANLKDIE